MKKEKLKSFIAGIITATLIFGTAITGFATVGTKILNASYNDIKIYVNQKEITPKDANGTVVEPFTVDGTTYLPVRAISNALGQEVSWDQNTKSVYIGTQPTSAQPTMTAKEVTLEPGEYTVGKDIAAGTYTLTAVQENGYVIATSGKGRIIVQEMFGVDSPLYKSKIDGVKLEDGAIVAIGYVTIKFTPQ